MKTKRRRQLELLLGLAAFYAALWLLWLTPVVLPLRIFVVLLHEISHALAGVATGGSVEKIVLNADEGGATWVRGGIPFIILSAGYLGSLLWGLALIEAAGARPKRVRLVLGGLGAFILIITLLYMRNVFGFLFSGAFGGLLLTGARWLRPRRAAIVLLVLGLTSALYALLDIRSDILDRPHIPSDAYLLGELTGVPSLVWGLLWGGIGVVACWYALKRWLGRA
jgi:hypothetical protein